MRRTMAIAACALAIVACKKSEPSTAAPPPKVVTTVVPEDVQQPKNIVIRPDVPNVLDKSLLGTALAADGTVAEEVTEFKAGQPIALSIWLKQSPPGLNTGVMWYGADEQVFERDKRPMNGATVATFTLKKKLKPGKYRVEGYWGGNVVADKTFEVKKSK